MRDPFDEPISIVEELDPEPEPTGRWFHLREVLLGFLLLVGVLGWSGWEWWQQDRQATNYRIAQQAADDQDWDRALQYFTSIKGFKDADARAAEMNKLVTERDTQYEIASSSAEKGEWAATLRAAEAVRRVQRDYRDTSQLEAQASWEVYRGALQGVIALRTQGRKPALYYRGASGWEWLARSDRRSQILPNLGSNGDVVYDIPGENWDTMKLTPTATPSPRNFRVPGMPSLKGRALWIARHEGERLHDIGVSFDPAEYNYYWVGEKGMWAIRLNADRTSSRPRVLAGYGSIEVDYQAFGGPEPVKVDIQPSWTAMDFAPDGEHILLVDEGPESNPQRPLDIYLADAVGGNKKLLYSYDGSIQALEFSPDSKHALLTAYAYRAGKPGSTTYLVMLIDLQKGTLQTLVERTVQFSDSTNYPLPVAGAFLTEGRFKGYVLATDGTGASPQMYLFAPGRPPPLLSIPVEEMPDFIVWTAQRGDNTLLMWREERGSTSEGRPLVIVEIAPDWSVTTSTMLIRGDANLAFLGARDGLLLFEFSEYKGGASPASLSNFVSIPIAEIHSKKQLPAPFYSIDFSASEMVAFTQPFYSGPTMLSYVDKGDLHVQTYDGKVDLTLESGIQYLYDPLFNTTWLPLR